MHKLGYIVLGGQDAVEFTVQANEKSYDHAIKGVDQLLKQLLKDRQTLFGLGSIDTEQRIDDLRNFYFPEDD